MTPMMKLINVLNLSLQEITQQQVRRNSTLLKKMKNLHSVVNDFSLCEEVN